MGHRNAAQALMNSFSFGKGECETEIETLIQRIDQQNLVIQTILVLALEKGVFSEDEFRSWVKQMDELDGVRDGKLADAPVDCPNCGKPNSKTASKCEHCGREIEPDMVPKRP